LSPISVDWCKCQDTTEPDISLKMFEKRLQSSTGGTPSVPNPPPPASAEKDRLESWKEIAAFLGRDERTAMRWEALGLPIRRIPGHKRSRVYASRAEIAQWRSQDPDSALADTGIGREPNVPNSITEGATLGSLHRRWPRKRLVSGLAICALGMLTLGVIARNHSQSGLPTSVRFTENAFEALDDKGRSLWKHTFAHSLAPQEANSSTIAGLAQFARIGDLIGDGKQQVLVVAPVRSGPNPSDSSIVEVDCFSSGGALLWSYVPDNTFKFGDHELKGPWLIYDLVVSREGPTKSIWIAAAHRVWGNSFVVQLDPKTGRGPTRFVNTGSVYVLQELRMADRTFLLVGGFNNEYEMGSLAVINEAKPFAASPQTSGTRHKCVTCPDGNPDYYFTFPRSEINVLEKDWLNAVKNVSVDGGEILASKSEFPNRSGVQSLYLLRLEPTVAVMSLRYSSDYDLAHRELERLGKIKHSLASCPERLDPAPVKVWTPSKGWVNLKLKPAGAGK
jgi:hypothetical protein